MNSATNVFASAAPLVSAQPKAMSRTFELRSGDDLIGQLRFEKPCGSFASAEVAAEKWTFKREGFLAPRVTVRAPNSVVDLAIFRPHWGSGGTLDFRDGLQLRWRCTNFWRSQYAFVGADDRALVRFSHHEGFFKASARLEIDPPSAAIAELPLLVAIGWYLMILAAEDATAAVGSTAVTG
jgi:hypothetical protein